MTARRALPPWRCGCRGGITPVPALKPEQFRPALGPAGLSATVQRAGSGRIEANSSTARPRLSFNLASVRCSTHGKFISDDTEFTLKRLENLFMLMLAMVRTQLDVPRTAIS